MGFVALLLGCVTHGFRNASAIELTDEDVVADMGLFASDVVDVTREQFEMTLDYSPESIENVEPILAMLHDRHAKAPFTGPQLADHALQWGGYVGEVLKTVGDCDWA